MKRYHRSAYKEMAQRELDYAFDSSGQRKSYPYYSQRGKRILKETLFNALALTCGTESGAWLLKREVNRMIGFTDDLAWRIAEQYTKENHPLEVEWDEDEDYYHDR